MSYNLNNIEKVIANKLQEAVHIYKNRELKVLDIGIFPWHKSIEISLLFSDEKVDVDDIAAWENYNFSDIYEGKWQEAQIIGDEMYQVWEKECNVIPILEDFAEAVSSDTVTNIIKMFNLAPDFVVQLLNPDDSESKNFISKKFN
ncbi:hypothetical protein QJU43_04155 [Pasteurella atlantica]|uniref:hypothetical protein n=1 Tax=Pasteurellaceae TaxID=712 RepID=UPI00276A0C18|nr:hypothetical protein [Pasteurella atlantica]MDP8033683.1 hypothetical protein [Pasteurella atlantica]MDP8035537.1 hypothetical protein [Pasteurella atlantica]MDP8037488.1 hypothetical protein [Pasteurella atlantica]MDP8047837.1 hypothetical protein [Pasteurella atlantica]MDP8049792.1 hypothetical protein [Pasteurella atlantica]